MVVCFTWLVARGAVLTWKNLRKRGIRLCSRCYLSGKETETNNHMFLHCKFTNQLWDMFINLKRVRWTKPGNTVDLLASCNKGNSGNRVRWKIVLASIWWTIWKERNARCFENTSCSLQKIKSKCILLFGFWCISENINTHDVISEVLGPL
ncbi:unnamed protein product [Withania somnifera]